MPTVVVVASTDAKLRGCNFALCLSCVVLCGNIFVFAFLETVQQLFASGSLRVYTTDDVVGVEVGGALKNVFAIAGESYSLVSNNRG